MESLGEEERILVVATGNPGKTLEISHCLKGLPLVLKNLKDFEPIPEVIEDGKTFLENALKKARFAAASLGLPAIADDSGLEVDALCGAPGIFSARYSGSSATDAQNIAKLLAEMSGKEDRSARFVCVIVAALPSGETMSFEGRCEGFISKLPAGENGFGYDPIFFYPPLNRTFAQMSAHEKCLFSHRGMALSKLGSNLHGLDSFLGKSCCCCGSV